MYQAKDNGILNKIQTQRTKPLNHCGFFGSSTKNFTNQQYHTYISQNSIFLKWIIYNIVFNQGIFLIVSKRRLNNYGFYMHDHVIIFTVLMLTRLNIYEFIKVYALIFYLDYKVSLVNCGK